MGDSVASSGHGDARSNDGSFLDEALRLSEQARELQDAASAFISRTWNEEQTLCRRALSLDSDLRLLHSSLDSASKSFSFDQKMADKHLDWLLAEEEIDRARCLLRDEDVASVLPYKDHGWFLKMFLGPLNVRAKSKKLRLKVKEE